MKLPDPILQQLHDNTSVTLRPIQSTDAPGLINFYRRLSPETIYLRFLNVHPAFTERDALNMATVDYQTSMAFVATVAADAQTLIIGVARYSTLDTTDPHNAEAAVVVEDRYQGKGLGSLLMRQLILYARQQGIQQFIAEVNVTNEKMLRFIQRSGLPSHRQLEEGLWEVRIDIVDENS